MAILTIDPRSGKNIATYSPHTTKEIDQKLHTAQERFRDWRKTSLSERSALLKRLSKTLLEKKNEYAALMQAEMGKSLAEGVGEIEKCSSCVDYYAENAEKFLSKQVLLEKSPRAYVHFEPLGTVFAIMPWNFPFWQALRCAIPSITAGNSVLLKHASNVSGCSLALEKLFLEAGAPIGLFQSLLLSGTDAETLIERQEIQAVSFTGSTSVGKKIAAAAGKSLKKCVLELGGSDAYIVLADADLAKAAKTCASSRLINAGQSCIAAKRFIVEKSVYQEFTKLLTEEMKKMELAPQAREDLREQLHKQVQQSVEQGAKLLCGGEIPKSAGYYYPATVLGNVRPGITAFEEELFGPVAAVVEAKDVAEAIRLANQSIYGLGAAVFTKDIARGEKIAAEELEAGSCFVNSLVRSDPRLPFGGTKESGFGRELSEWGIHEFTNIKTVYLE